VRNERDLSSADGGDARQGVGVPLRRKEDDRLMRGRGQFVADIRPAGLQDVAFVRSPLAHARIRAIHVPERYRANVFTAADLVDSARRRRLDLSRATLFRSIDLLTDLGVVERVDLPSGEHAYVPCAPAHHHHVVCSRCGRTVEVEDCGVAAAVDEISRRSGYTIESHRLELYGVCGRCQELAETA